eukprot:gene4080-14177_t
MMLQGKRSVIVRAPRGQTQRIRPAVVQAGKRATVVSRCSPESSTVPPPAAEASVEETKPQAESSNGNGVVAVKDDKPLPEGVLSFVTPPNSENFWTQLKLAFALPWRRFSAESVLSFKLEGDISDQSRSTFDSGLSVPQICSAMRKAAVDPRIKGICIEIGPLGVGWAKLQEIRRYIKYFRESGKFTVAYMTRAAEKEYYLASAFEEIYMPESSSLSLKGFAVTGTFLRGVLDKIGVEPQVKRIGNYKSAGDQLLRKDMSEYQAEQLTAILDDITNDFVSTIAEARGKTKEEVLAMMEEGIFDMQKFMDGGWLTGLRYEDEVIDDMKKRTGGKDDEVRSVGLKKYSKVSPTVFGLAGKKKIVVLRTSGAIVGGNSNNGGVITAGPFIKQLRSLAKNKNIAAVVLRVDSPGGDALASDLMWREIKKLAEKKPVVASMGDVAASGGYYLAMGCNKILAEPLTITGSVGVVTGKFNLAELYEKIGYAKTIISNGKYAEVLADNRPFNASEQEFFDRNADFAYESFRNKAAGSRGLSIEAMQAGRVWSGARALEVGLVDALGGVHRAIEVAKQLAEIPEGGGASASSSSMLMPLLMAMASGASLETAMAGVMAASGGFNGMAPFSANSMDASFSASLPQFNNAFQLQQPGIQCVMSDVDAASVGGLTSLAGTASSQGSSDSFLSEEGENPIACAFEGLAEMLL